MQTKGAYTFVLQETAEKILLPMRQRRGAHEGVSSAYGKRQGSRDSRGRISDRGGRIKFTPRPHLEIRVRDIRMWALLDSGSEISFVNAATVEKARQRGIIPEADDSSV